MQILRIPVGQLSTNCYLLYDEIGGAGAIIDPGAEAFTILGTVEKRRLKVEHILLTHGHSDHLGAAAKLQEKLGAKILIHSADAQMAVDSELNLSSFLGIGRLSVQPDQLLVDGEVVQVLGKDCQLIHTPGHTPGSSCFYLPDLEVLFSGDTLFAGGFGRTDLAGGDPRALKVSLDKLVDTVPLKIPVYPGHGVKTTIETEKSLISLLD